MCGVWVCALHSPCTISRTDTVHNESKHTWHDVCRSPRCCRWARADTNIHARMCVRKTNKHVAQISTGSQRYALVLTHIFTAHTLCVLRCGSNACDLFLFTFSFYRPPRPWRLRFFHLQRWCVDVALLPFNYLSLTRPRRPTLTVSTARHASHTKPLPVTSNTKVMRVCLGQCTFSVSNDASDGWLFAKQTRCGRDQHRIQKSNKLAHIINRERYVCVCVLIIGHLAHGLYIWPKLVYPELESTSTTTEYDGMRHAVQILTLELNTFFWVCLHILSILRNTHISLGLSHLGRGQNVSFLNYFTCIIHDYLSEITRYLDRTSRPNENAGATISPWPNIHSSSCSLSSPLCALHLICT